MKRKSMNNEEWLFTTRFVIELYLNLSRRERAAIVVVWKTRIDGGKLLNEIIFVSI